MTERELAGRKARQFFDDLWQQGDPWELESAAFEQRRHAHQFALLKGRRYARALEIGCGAGGFTRRLARIAERVVALDVAPAAIARARAAAPGTGSIDFRVANAMDYDPGAEGPWDLIVLSETIYYLGWLYSFFDVAWLAAQLHAASREGGRLLLANNQGESDDYLIRPWVIRTYRDLFLNVGFRLEAEEIYRDSKRGVALEVLVSLFARAP